MAKYNLSKIAKFKQNKKAFYSLILFSIIFFLSLIVEIYTNDRPILVKYQDNYYFPIFKDYPESKFGGDFATKTDYLDPYIQNIIKQDGFIIFPLFKYNFDTINYHLENPPPTPPSLENILGTDDHGRDVFARLIYGLRISLLFGLTLTIISSVIGIFLGLSDFKLSIIILIWTVLPSLAVPQFWEAAAIPLWVT